MLAGRHEAPRIRDATTRNPARSHDDRRSADIGYLTTTSVRNVFEYCAAYKLMQQTLAATATARERLTSK